MSTKATMKASLGETTDGKKIFYEDITPTWSGSVHALIALVENGTPASKNFAKGELIRMARILDSKLGNL